MLCITLKTTVGINWWGLNTSLLTCCQSKKTIAAWFTVGDTDYNGVVTHRGNNETVVSAEHMPITDKCLSMCVFFF